MTGTGERRRNTVMKRKSKTIANQSIKRVTKNPIRHKPKRLVKSKIVKHKIPESIFDLV